MVHPSDEAHDGQELDEFWSAMAECRGDLPALLRVIAGQVMALMGGGCVLTTLDRSRLRLQAAIVLHEDPEVAAAMAAAIGGVDIALGEGLAGTAAAERRMIVLNDLDPELAAATVGERFEPFAKTHPIRALAVVPMVAAGELVGTLGSVRTSGGSPYTAVDVRRIEALAERAAVAIAATVATPRDVGCDDYEALFRHSIDGLLITTPDGGILAANEAMCELLGMTEDEIVAAGRQGIVDAESPNLPSALAERASVGRTRSELVFRRRDGSTFVGDVTSTIYASSAGALRASVIVRDVNAQVQRIATLEALADRDPLTGLWNRRGWAIASEQALSGADRHGLRSQLLFFDVDDLKGLNDRSGHAAGDAAIAAVGRAIAAASRYADVACRFGGDEFLVLMVDATPRDVPELVDRVIDLLAADRTIPPSLSVTVGHADRYPRSDTPIDALIEAADNAMYGNKVVKRIRRR